MRTLDASPRDRHALADLDAITGAALSRSDLARYLGVDEATVSRWWSGERAMPVAGLLAIGRRVVAGSREAGARFVDSLGHALGLPGRWVVDAAPSPGADGHTIASLARAAGLAADLLEDGAVTVDEVASAVALVERLEREAARLRVSIERAR